MAWRKSAAFMPMIAALLLAPGAPHLTPADAASCPNLISACGCVIASPGIYLAANTLVASASNQTCIEITSRASGAILNLNGFNMFGSDGTGTGILIDKGASRVIVEGGIESGSGTAMAHDGGPAEGPPCGAAVAGQAQVSRWNIGIEDDGDDAIIALFSSVGGVFALPRPTPGNTSAGVMLNGVRNSFVGDLQADYNQSGLVVRDSTDVSIANFTSCFNTVDGLDLVSAIGTTVGPGGCESNGRYGVHLVAASRTTIHDSNGNMQNGDTGIVLEPGSNQNHISNAGAPRNAKAGLLIARGSTDNVITVTHNEDNGNPHSDMIDLNPGCDHNTWYNNVGDHDPAQSCIR